MKQFSKALTDLSAAAERVAVPAGAT